MLCKTHIFERQRIIVLTLIRQSAGISTLATVAASSADKRRHETPSALAYAHGAVYEYFGFNPAVRKRENFVKRRLAGNHDP